uniref:Gnk2-homologous domain-containing protein n=1 Tax=Brassica oleracea var. oleracea TaxID=109376 RepID=A0A0D3BCW0_BRAOL
MSSGCDQVPDNFNKSSSDQSNLETVLSILRDPCSHGSYANATAGLSPNTVYGMFLCRGDIISNQTLSGKINELIPRACFSSPIPYFVEDQEHVTQVESSYDLKAIVQCSPDLDPRNCTACLRLAAQFLYDCCGLASLEFAQIYYPKCLVNYKISASQSLRVING